MTATLMDSFCKLQIEVSLQFKETYRRARTVYQLPLGVNYDIAGKK